MKNNLKHIREQSGKLQSTVANKLGILISVLNDIESNNENNELINNEQLIEKVCKYFKVTKDDLFIKDGNKIDAMSVLSTKKGARQTKYLFLDTSILIERHNVIHKYFNVFDKLCVPKTVIKEIINQKDTSKNYALSEAARFTIRELQLYDETEIIKEFDHEKGSNNDEKIFNAATNYAKSNPNIQVVLLAKDRDFKMMSSPLSNFLNLSEVEYRDYVETLNNNFDKEKTDYFWDCIIKNDYNNLEKMKYDMNGIDVNGIYKNDYNPLCYAIMNRLDNVFRFLIHLDNIDFNVTGSEPLGYGPLHCAVDINNAKYVNDILNNSNAYVDIFTKDTRITNVTPLMIAAAKGQNAMVEILLSKDASTNQQDSLGETALHKAARKNRRNCYNLLNKITDKNILCSNYKYATDYMD